MGNDQPTLEICVDIGAFRISSFFKAGNISFQDIDVDAGQAIGTVFFSGKVGFGDAGCGETPNDGRLV